MSGGMKAKREERKAKKAEKKAQKAAMTKLDKIVDASKTMVGVYQKGEKVTATVKKYVVPAAIVAFVAWAYAAYDVDIRKQK